MSARCKSFIQWPQYARCTRETGHDETHQAVDDLGVELSWDRHGTVVMSSPDTPTSAVDRWDDR